MRSKSTFLVITAALMALASTTAASGAVLQGSFEGIATGSRVYSPVPGETNFDGEVVTGTFSIDPTVTPIYSEVRNGDGYFTVASSTVGLTVQAHGLVSTYGRDNARPQSGSVTLTNTANLQQALIGVDAGSPYHNALIQLNGPLFSGIDLATLHADDVDLSRSFIGFFDSRDFGSGVTLTSLTFASAVPEPQILWLMALGLCGVALKGVRRKFFVPTTRAGASVEEVSTES